MEHLYASLGPLDDNAGGDEFLEWLKRAFQAAMAGDEAAIGFIRQRFPFRSQTKFDDYHELIDDFADAGIHLVMLYSIKGMVDFGDNTVESAIKAARWMERLIEEFGEEHWLLPEEEAKHDKEVKSEFTLSLGVMLVGIDATHFPQLPEHE